MAQAVAVLHDQGLYRSEVPDQSTTLRIDSVYIEPLTSKPYVSTGMSSVIPERFKAHFSLGFPEATATMEVFVDQSRGPKVVELSVRSKTENPVSTRLLRQVHVDKLLQYAVAEARRINSDETVQTSPPSEDAREIAQGLEPDEQPALSTKERQRLQAKKDAQTAARLWQEAVASGAKAPREVVASKMQRSVSQVARYLRHAKDLDILPHTDAR